VSWKCSFQRVYRPDSGSADSKGVNELANKTNKIKVKNPHVKLTCGACPQIQTQSQKIPRLTSGSPGLLSSRLLSGALGKSDQLIHGPLVIGMGPVFRRFDLPGRRDQKIARESQ